MNIRFSRTYTWVLLICLLAIMQLLYAAPTNALSSTCENNIETWYRGADIPNIHLEGGKAVVGGKLYVFGGFYYYNNITFFASDIVDVYDPASNLWETAITPLNPMPFEASHMQAAVQDDRYVWFAGGFYGDNPGTASVKTWRYDTVTDTWTAQADLPAPRSAGGLVVIGTELHYFGSLSIDRMTDIDTHWVLDLTNPVSWQTRTSFLYPRNHIQGALIDGKVYVPGGQDGHDFGGFDVDILTIYDPVANNWSYGASLPAPRSHAEAGILVVNERVFMVGGRHEGVSTYNNIIEYNPQTDSWRTVGYLPRWWYFPSVAFVDDKLIVTAGGVAWDNLTTDTWITDITLDCPAGPPVASADNYSTNQDVTLNVSASGVLGNDTDPNGDSITAVLDSTTSNGTLTLNKIGRAHV